jgi:hypothetical protein
MTILRSSVEPQSGGLMSVGRGWRGALAALAICGAASRGLAAEPPVGAGPPGDPEGVRLGGFAGYGAATTSGLVLRADGDVPFRSFGSRLSLAWLGSLGFSRLTRGEGGFGVTRSVTVMVLGVVPGMRLSRPFGERVTGYLDAGVGVYRAGTTVRQEFAFGLGHTTASTSELAGMARLGAGLWVRAAPRLDVGAGFGLEPHFGRFAETTFVLQAGAMYRL